MNLAGGLLLCISMAATLWGVRELEHRRLQFELQADMQSALRRAEAVLDLQHRHARRERTTTVDHRAIAWRELEAMRFGNDSQGQLRVLDLTGSSVSGPSGAPSSPGVLRVYGRPDPEWRLAVLAEATPPAAPSWREALQSLLDVRYPVLSLALLAQWLVMLVLAMLGHRRAPLPASDLPAAQAPEARRAVLAELEAALARHVQLRGELQAEDQRLHALLDERRARKQATGVEKSFSGT